MSYKFKYILFTQSSSSYSFFWWQFPPSYRRLKHHFAPNVECTIICILNVSCVMSYSFTKFNVNVKHITSTFCSETPHVPTSGPAFHWHWQCNISLTQRMIHNKHCYKVSCIFINNLILHIMIYGCIKHVMNALIGNYGYGYTESVTKLICRFII